MKKVLSFFWKCVKWLFIIVVCVEVLSFVAITASNYLIYGGPRDAAKSVYDPYTLFRTISERLTAYNSADPDEKLNRTIWLFGGSTMRAGSVAADETIPSFLAKRLNGGQHRLHFTLRNLGIASFNSLMEAKYLQKMFVESPSSPNLVIFYDGANDATYFGQHRTAHAHHGYREIKGFLESYHRSRFGLLKPINAAIRISFTKELYDKIGFVAVPVKSNTLEFRKMVDRAARRYDHVDKLARTHGANFLLVWQPMRWVEQCHRSKSVGTKDGDEGKEVAGLGMVRRNISVVYNALMNELRNKSYFTSLRDALCGRTVTVYQPDGVHLTPAGNELIAERLSTILGKRFPELVGLDTDLDEPSEYSAGSQRYYAACKTVCTRMGENARVSCIDAPDEVAEGDSLSKVKDLILERICSRNSDESRSGAACDVCRCAAWTLEIKDYLMNGNFDRGMDQWACSAEHYFVENAGTESAVFWAHHNGGGPVTPILYQDVWNIPAGTAVSFRVSMRNVRPVRRNTSIVIWEGREGKRVGPSARRGCRLTTDWQEFSVDYTKKNQNTKIRIEIAWQDRKDVSIQIDKASLKSENPVKSAVTQWQSGTLCSEIGHGTDSRVKQ